MVVLLFFGLAIALCCSISIMLAWHKFIHASSVQHIEVCCTTNYYLIVLYYRFLLSCHFLAVRLQFTVWLCLCCCYVVVSMCVSLSVRNRGCPVPVAIVAEQAFSETAQPALFCHLGIMSSRSFSVAVSVYSDYFQYYYYFIISISSISSILAQSSCSITRSRLTSLVTSSYNNVFIRFV